MCGKWLDYVAIPSGIEKVGGGSTPVGVWSGLDVSSLCAASSLLLRAIFIISSARASTVVKRAVLKLNKSRTKPRIKS